MVIGLDNVCFMFLTLGGMTVLLKLVVMPGGANRRVPDYFAVYNRYHFILVSYSQRLFVEPHGLTVRGSLD